MIFFHTFAKQFPISVIGDPVSGIAGTIIGIGDPVSGVIDPVIVIAGTIIGSSGQSSV